ncbi:MAG: hypothetical protein M3R04_02050 [bacterium]|nr:hypothetical protein [bacterium]
MQPAVLVPLREGFHNLFNPDNPFVPWLLLIDLVLLLVHIYIVYWVYRDAAWRYNRGAPWGLITAVLPLAGWMFYLAYRSSPLVQFDRLDAEDFDESEHEWTDYDTYKADRGKAWFREMVSESSGYSAWTQLSRTREKRKRLTPEERLEVRKLRADRKAGSRARRAERIAGRREQRKQVHIAARERQTVVGLHGASQRMSDRKQRALRRQLEVVEQLKTMPREDAHLEELIYEMRYRDALVQARDALEVATEMEDQQGVVTYEAYIARLENLE